MQPVACTISILRSLDFDHNRSIINGSRSIIEGFRSIIDDHK